jgi:hypothetical protein
VLLSREGHVCVLLLRVDERTRHLNSNGHCTTVRPERRSGERLESEGFWNYEFPTLSFSGNVAYRSSFHPYGPRVIRPLILCLTAPSTPASLARSARCVPLLRDGTCPRPRHPRSRRVPPPIATTLHPSASALAGPCYRRASHLTPAASMPLGGIELRADEHPFVRTASRCYAESACFSDVLEICCKCCVR